MTLDIDILAEVIATGIRTSTASMAERIAVLETRAPVPGPAGDRGERGEPGMPSTELFERVAALELRGSDDIPADYLALSWTEALQAELK